MVIKKVSVALGGTNVLAVPFFLRGLFIKCAKIFGVNQFDTAQYYGASEQVLSNAKLSDVQIVSKWGIGQSTDPFNPDPKRWFSEFSADRLEIQVARSVNFFTGNNDIGFALHRPAEQYVQEHVKILLGCKASGLVDRVGYSCDTQSEILEDNSWCDFIITHYSLAGAFTGFKGQVFLHGVFKDRLDAKDLRAMVAGLSSCDQVTFLIGTSRPWRFIKALRLVKKVAEFELAKHG
tara:strand:- start:1539 stop:2243 length:705 start_codon:yes stop_codon:yes gene_type:complete